MPRISLTLQGENALVRAFDSWAKDVANMRPAFRDLAIDVIAPTIEARFAARGPGWAPLSPAYAAWKAEHFPGKGLLERTGAMKAQLTNRSRFGGPAFQATANSLTVDAAATPYWRFHQTGTKRLPARPLLVFDGAFQEQASAYLGKWLTGRAREYGLERGRFTG